MRERDLLMTEEHAGGKNILYVVTPSPMMEWMQVYVDDSIRDKSNVKLIPSKYFNPEQFYYYQVYESNKYRDVEAGELLDKDDERKILTEKDCVPLTQEVCDERIRTFEPATDDAK